MATLPFHRWLAGSSIFLGSAFSLRFTAAFVFVFSNHLIFYFPIEFEVAWPDGAFTPSNLCSSPRGDLDPCITDFSSTTAGDILNTRRD